MLRPDGKVFFHLIAYDDGMMVISDGSGEDGYPDEGDVTRIVRMLRSIADAMESGRAVPGPPPLPDIPKGYGL